MNWILAAAFAAVVVLPVTSWAHCDGFDGPVVQAARDALNRGDVRPALSWVRAGDEPEIRTAFAQALAVRKLSPEAQSLADRYFFETLVRVHRAAEGAPYTGLKPAGRDLGPAIPAADRALTDGSIDPLLRLLTGDVQSGVRRRFQHAREARKLANTSVEAGREYVHAYVEFIHYVEGIHSAGAGLQEHSDEKH